MNLKFTETPGGKKVSEVNQAIEKERTHSEKSAQSKKESKAKKDGTAKKDKDKKEKEDRRPTAAADDPSSEAININPEHGKYLEQCLKQNVFLN